MHPAGRQTWHGQRAYGIFHQASCWVFAGSLQAVHGLSVKHLWGLNPEAALKNRYRHSIYVLIKSFNLTHVVWLANGFGFGCFLTELVVGLPWATPLWLIGHPDTKLHASVDPLPWESPASRKWEWAIWPCHWIILNTYNCYKLLQYSKPVHAILSKKNSSSSSSLRLIQPEQVNRNCVNASVKRAMQQFNDRAVPVCHITYTCV